jgi:hypothetical protein
VAVRATRIVLVTPPAVSIYAEVRIRTMKNERNTATIAPRPISPQGVDESSSAGGVVDVVGSTRQNQKNRF